MSYTLRPLNSNVSVVELKPKEVQELTGKSLVDLDTSGPKVLNYGRVVEVGAPSLETLYKAEQVPLHNPSTIYPYIKAGDIVLFQKLAAHKSNFGMPRILLVPIDYIEGKLEQTDANG